MKTCRKCKKQVANNTKICKYCGADLTKKKTTSTKKKEKVEKVKETSHLLETKTEFLYTEVLEKVNEDKDLSKTEVLSFDSPQIINKKETLNITNKEYQADNYYTFTGNKINFNEKDTKKVKTSVSKTKKLSNNKDNTLKKKDDLKNKNNSKTKDEPKKLTRAQQIYLVKKRLIRRRITTCFLIILLILGLGYLSYKIYDSYEDLGYIITGEERENNIFNMKDVITYKDVSFSILDVEVSNGTKYKRPKEGNQFLIVTISFKNNSHDKYHYSGKYFTMTNSLEEETEKIISPVNAGHALYSGDLVIGASKEASLVFEQPIDDPNLKILYYDPFELEEYEKKLENIENSTTDENIEDETEENEMPEIKKPYPIFQVKIKTK